MEDVVQGRRTIDEKKIKHRKKNKKKDKKKTGKRPVDTPVTKSNHVDGGDDVMMGLTDTMQRASLVPRSVSFGRRARNRAPERSQNRRPRPPLVQPNGGRTFGLNKPTATERSEGNLLAANTGKVSPRPNRRERRAAARAAAAAAQGNSNMDVDM